MRTPSRSVSGQTTYPADCTDCTGESSRSYSIEWVFPSSALTRLTTNVTTLGRDAECGTQLAGKQTSRVHARVGMHGRLPTVEDMGSRNGLFLNGQKVGRAVVAPGDVLRLGDWIGIVVIGASANECSAIAPSWFGGRRLATAVDPARKVAATDLPVVIQGETGVGKEGLARAIHAWSARPGPFVPINCAAIPPSLAEAELFGHGKGAFTGADRPALGYFRAAHRGTLFLDEVLELPSVLQAKLLRAIETQEVWPVGDTRPVPVDVRILSASQESLDSAVSQRGFRLDLMARLDGITVVLPPLRQRREDIVPIFMELLRDKSGGHPPAVDPKFVESLLLYDWPLNVREVVLFVRKMLALHSTEPVLKRGFLPPQMLFEPEFTVPSSTPRASTEDPAAFQALVKALEQNGGNVTAAANALGITRARAYRLLNANPDFPLEALRRPEEP